ncbi:hypothetical protein EON65_58280 [archaeon]|nr:MAG: hypothetical protein EON65_58280 [archaeon]
MVMCMSLSVTTMMWQMLMVRYVQYETPSCPLSKYGDAFVLNRMNDRVIEDVAPKEVGGIMLVGRGELGNAEVKMEEALEAQAKGDNEQKDSHGDVLVDMIRASHGIDSSKCTSAEDKEKMLREAARLYELHTVCGRAWQSVRKTQWIVVYISVFFYTCIAFDMAGDADGWLMGLWVVVYGLLFVVLLKTFGLSALQYILEKAGDRRAAF